MFSEKIFKKFSKFFSPAIFADFITTASPLKKAELIAPYILERCFIQTEGKAMTLYIMDNNFTYRDEKDVDNHLITVVSIFLYETNDYLKINDELEYFKIIKPLDKLFECIFKNSYISTFKAQLIVFLTRRNVKFNRTPGQIHFNNGYMMTKTGEFKQRDETFMITKYIEHDYIPSTKEERDIVMKAYDQIYPIKEDRDIVLGNIGIALSWEATKNQTSLFLTGTGSSGKSFVMETLGRALGPYFIEMKGDTFSNDAKMDKVLNTMGMNPQALLVWINELVGTKMNTSVFKEFCDGTTNTTKLYEDGSHNTKHNAYVVSTGNELPNMIQDSGTKRRIMGYTHTSEFTSDEDRCDDKQNIYRVDKDLKYNLPVNAIFDIFVNYCKTWAKNSKSFDISKSENFKSTSDIMTSSNDFFQDFIDSKLIITNNEKDRIGKDKMREMYLQMYPDKHITVLQIISSLRDKRINYDKGFRHDNIRGCFIGVKAKADIMDEDEEEGEKKEKTINDIKKELQEMKKKYDQLKKILNMKRQLEAIDGKKEEPITDYETTEEDKPQPKVDNDTIIDDENDDDHVQRCEADEDDLLNDDLTICFGI
jgi:hypothetical protein